MNPEVVADLANSFGQPIFWQQGSDSKPVLAGHGYISSIKRSENFGPASAVENIATKWSGSVQIVVQGEKYGQVREALQKASQDQPESVKNISVLSFRASKKGDFPDGVELSMIYSLDDLRSFWNDSNSTKDGEFTKVELEGLRFLPGTSQLVEFNSALPRAIDLSLIEGGDGSAESFVDELKRGRYSDAVMNRALESFLDSESTIAVERLLQPEQRAQFARELLGQYDQGELGRFEIEKPILDKLSALVS